MGSVLDSIRSVQESIERIAKQTGTEHLFGNIGYILGLEDIDGKSKSKATEKTQKADTQNTSDVSVDKPTTSESKSVTDTIREILATVDKIALESGTERLFENLDQILGVKREENQEQIVPKGYKDYQEEYFTGWLGLKRYYQALYYPTNSKKQDAYGMECNGTTIMYFLQSLGLFPLEMTRKEFEYAFVPNAYPYAKINDKNTPITVDSLPVDPYNPKDMPLPIPNGTLLFPKNVFSEALLGQLKLETNSGISLVGQSLSLAITKMTNITSNFALELPKQEKYSFITKYHKPTVENDIKDNSAFIVDLSQQLANSDFDASYFNQGKSVFVSVDYGYFDGSTSHYALIQGASVANFVYKGKKYYIYPADDSLVGLAFVIAPTFIGNIQDIDLEGIGKDGSYTHKNIKGKLHSVSRAYLQIGLPIRKP